MAYDNRIINNYSNRGYNVSVTHVPTGVTISFPAFLTEYSDSSEAQYERTTIPGAVNPVASHVTTKRSVEAGIEIVSDSLEEAKRNFDKLKKMSLFYYRARNKITQEIYVNDYSIPNFVRIKFANLIGRFDDRSGPGLLGYPSGFSITPKVEHGFFEDVGAIYPKTYQLRISIEVTQEELPNLTVNPAPPNANPEIDRQSKEKAEEAANLNPLPVSEGGSIPPTNAPNNGGLITTNPTLPPGATATGNTTPTLPPGTVGGGNRVPTLSPSTAAGGGVNVIPTAPSVPPPGGSTPVIVPVPVATTGITPPVTSTPPATANPRGASGVAGEPPSLEDYSDFFGSDLL